MRLLIIADPMARLKPLGDTTLALVRAALRHGLTVHWAAGEDVAWNEDHVVVRAEPVLRCAADELGELGPAAPSRLDAFDAVLIRKDPPFDESYVKLCWLLALEEPRVWMMNRPSLLLRYHEKLGALEALAQGFLRKEDVIPTFIGNGPEAAAFLRARKADVSVSKPFLGFGGTGVQLWKSPELPTGEELVVQPFLPEVQVRGDRRVIYLDGELLAHFSRMPPDGSIVSNLAQGGRAVALPLLPRERESIERLGKFLKATGIFFAGADLIGHYVSEVNVTSPTGLRSLEKLDGRDYGVPIIEAVAKAAAAQRRRRASG